MGHCRLKIILFSFFITTCFRYSNACGIDDTVLGISVNGWLRDVDEGIIWRNKTTNVIGITSYQISGVSEGIEYLSVQLIDSKFELFTTEFFKEYEEIEVSATMTLAITYHCTGINNQLPQIILMHVNDTNNNPPTFLRPNEYVFNIAAPMPPGYVINGCSDLITVRDIDLTTQKIIFEIEDNPYFEMEKEIYRNTSTPKEFKAILRTKTLIRTFPKELTLTIWATDSDLTLDKPRTKEATITFYGNTDFVLPEEPVFSETFYLADYTNDKRVVLTEPISLQSGYDKLVQFNIRGDYSNYFELVHDEENKISIRVVERLAEEDLTATNIHLIVTADRELTSGASATVVLRLPEVVPLEFESGHYKGKIKDNNLHAPQLIISQGYEDTPVIATVLNGYSSYFSATVEENTITLSMRPLQESIILDNNFLNLEVNANNGRSTATTIVTLEIIKDDNVTPVFNKPIYIGSYSPTGLILEKIELVQGYDDVNSVDLHGGDEKKYFRPVLNGATVTIEAESIPPEIYSQERIVLTLEVTKPRTVGASATIIINLPAARVLEFEAPTHRGSLQNNALTLDPIRLTLGYDNTVVFTITGEFAKYFQVTNGQNPAIITTKPDIPNDVILNNNVIFLTLVASGLNAVTTTTNIILNIIKDDTTTPVFSSNIYYGTYLDISNFDIQNIHLTQGSDGDVTFKLDGEHAQYFDYSNKGNDIVVFPRSAIPQDVIFEKKVLVFNILAMKALTVGASAAISIRFPSDLTDQVILSFAQSTYTGTLASNGLAMDDSIKLSAGYARGTQFILTGEYRQHFRLDPNEDALTLTLLDSLPDEARERAFIVLEIQAERENAVSAWTSVVIEVVRQETVAPVFDQAYYMGAYNTESGLRFTQVISLSQGYDDTVSFTLEGAFTSLFDLTQRGSNSFVISAPNPIPSDVLQANSQFLFAVVATKPGALVARSAVSIDIEKDLTDRVVLAFAQITYTGILASNGLAMDDSIKLSAGYAPGTQFILTGEYRQHFRLDPNEDALTLTLLDSLPDEARERAFIVLEIQAERENAVSAWTSVIIEVVRQETVAPVFDQAYYRGAYNTESGLRFTQVISLSQGYDDTVSFTLEGAFTSLFDLTQRGSNSFVISAPNPIPSDVLQANSQFLFAVVATKPGALVARSAVSIDIEKDLTDRVVLAFAQITYTGILASNGLAMDDSIKLSAGYAPGTQFILTGEYRQHFRLYPNEDALTLTLLDSLPDEARERAFIVLEIQAERENAVSAWTSVVIEVVRQETVAPVFDQAYYRGAYNTESGLRFTQVISLSQGYDDTVSFTLEGAFTSLFDLTQRGSNSFVISAPNPIPSDVLQANSQFLFAVVATKPGALVARSAVSIDIEKDLTDRVVLAFAQITYTGILASNGLAMDDSIKLSAGYAPGTQFILTGEYRQHFRLDPNEDALTLTLLDSLPDEARERAFIVLEIQAERENAVSAWTSVIIEVVRQETVAPVFDQAYYRGAYNTESGLRFTQVISLSQGYDDTVSFTLEGAFTSLFDLTQRGSNSFVISAPNPIPSDVLQANSQFLFAVVATKPGALVARSAVSIDIEKDLTDPIVLAFAQITYTGILASNGLAMDDSIKLSAGYAPGTQFILTGEYRQHFRLDPNEDALTLTLLDSLPDEARERAFIVLEIQAERENAVSAWTSVVIEVVRQETVAPVFDQAYYRGAYNTEYGLRFTQVISLSQGYDDTVSFTLEGAFTSLFDLTRRGSNSFVISAPNPIPSDVLQANSQFLFAVVATKPGALVARSAVSIDIEKDLTDPIVLAFAQITYTGILASNGLAMDDSIKLSAGYAPGTQFILTGEYRQHFRLDPNEDALTLTLLDSLPDEARERAFIVLEIQAERENAVSAWTSVVIEVVRQETVAPVFDQAYYRGAYSTESGLRFTQVISLSQGYDDTVSFTLEGAFTSLFDLTQRGSNSFVISAPNPIPSDVLQANSQFLFAVVATKPGALVARSAVSIDIEKGETLEPIVTFSSETYRLSVDITQTGFVGRVAASANTGEDLTYSLDKDDAHLQNRLSINNEGELHLSAPANSGVYTFQVIATTVSSKATGTAWVHLTAQAVTVCEDKDIVMPPLIILERDEEAPHGNLVVLDPTQHAGCHFTLTNRWPTNQSWLYVNEFGLHTNAIDREHASIAFMALSQVQVELILHCRSDNDNAIREKRSKTTERVGHYNYGSNKWILTDTIPYNSRRSLVNLIVNDINDNDPIFVGVEHQPIAVGYPTAELEERILPRSLAELQATDADIGVNAALRYWSSENVLAVAPTTGFVHVRAGARLTHNQILVVSATDENGQGRTGTINLIVKLLDLNHIVVVTIRDAFLSDETTVLAQLSDAIGYEVKALRSVVISDDIDVDVTRNKREVRSHGASLQLYVYGIDQREAVTVDRLTADISANAAIASVVSTISLEDHLQDMNILDQQIGLLVATIILGVLLFVVILLVSIWFFLKWRKTKNFKELHDESSISNNSSLGELPKPETEQPRLNIEDLRRSERRLQEMLQAPIEEVTVEPMPKKTETPVEAILDLPINEPSAPIVIQSIDKLKDAEDSSDDEFGEVNKNRRKSVVTFNENVEKIIHVEDNVDDDGDDDNAVINPSIDASNSGFEIYRL